MDMFQVIRTSKIKSSLGEHSKANTHKDVVFESPCEETAKAKADFLNQGVLPAERDFLGTDYVVEKKEDSKEKQKESRITRKKLREAEAEDYYFLLRNPDGVFYQEEGVYDSLADALKDIFPALNPEGKSFDEYMKKIYKGKHHQKYLNSIDEIPTTGKEILRWLDTYKDKLRNEGATTLVGVVTEERYIKEPGELYDILEDLEPADSHYGDKEWWGDESSIEDYLDDLEKHDVDLELWGIDDYIPDEEDYEPDYDSDWRD